jgi:outer membrane murein-binding lipoprotein Lpp
MRRTVMLVVVAALCVVAAGATGLATRGTATAKAADSCQLGTKAGQVKHVIYLQFDNTHYLRDRQDVASDLEQMPNLLNFLKDNGTLLTNDHTILISHTAGGILSSLTGLYPDRMGQTVSNSYRFFRADGTTSSSSSFKYWTDTVDGSDDNLPNMVGDGGQTAPAPWLTYTHVGCNVGGVSAANIELENNNALFFTSLSAAAAAGATNIKVGDVSNFTVGEQITIDTGAATETATIAAVGTRGATGTGLTLTAPLANAHASGARVYGIDPAGDMTRVFGVGSPEWNEGRDSQLAASGTAARTVAQTDFVGYAIHCAQGAAPCAGNPHAKADDATAVPGSSDGYDALFGAKYVNPVIGSTSTDAGGRACVKATDGTNITDQFGQCGFPGFDGALAKNTLGMVASMQEHGIPVTYAYISDAHDNHTLTRASGPGEADYKQQLADYNAAFGAFFQRLKKDGIDKSNTLFVVTVDEGDHFAGGIGTPQPDGSLAYSHTACSELTTTCPTNQIGEITANLKNLLPSNEIPFTVHSDDAPTIYVDGQPTRTDPSVRKLARDLGALQGLDTYKGTSVDLTERLADPVEMNTLHMVNADPKRTPTLTMFGNADFFFVTPFNSNACGGTQALCVDPSFAWNHGDYQDEIANTWVGFVGPGVQNNGIDTDTWTDHVDVRPTINAVLGLGDDYTDDGRVITQVLTNKALPNELHQHSSTTEELGAMYKAINAPFGKFALDTLVASTTALKKPDTAAGNLAYDQIEAKIATLTAQRNQVAGAIRAALNDAARGDAKLDESNAKAWISQGQALLDAAAQLAATP